MKAHAALDSLTRPRRVEAETVRAIPPSSAPLEAELTLLCPGPVSTSARVKQALANADIAHRDRAFVEVLAKLNARLRRVAGAPEHDVLVLAAAPRRQLKPPRPPSWPRMSGSWWSPTEPSVSASPRWPSALVCR